MSDSIVKPAEQEKPVGVVKQYAVVQNGVITPDGEYARFATESGRKTPAVLFMSPDRTKAMGYRKRVQRRLDNIHAIGGTAVVMGTGIVDVVEVDTPAPRKREAKPAGDKPATANGDKSPPKSANTAGKK